MARARTADELLNHMTYLLLRSPIVRVGEDGVFLHMANGTVIQAVIDKRQVMVTDFKTIPKR